MPRTKKSALEPESIVKSTPESARRRFVRIGQARMVNALHAIRLIGNLASPGYEWTPDDVSLLHNTLMEAIDSAFARFQKSPSMPKLEELFRLDQTV